MTSLLNMCHSLPAKWEVCKKVVLKMHSDRTLYWGLAKVVTACALAALSYYGVTYLMRRANDLQAGRYNLYHFGLIYYRQSNYLDAFEERVEAIFLGFLGIAGSVLLLNEFYNDIKAAHLSVIKTNEKYLL